MRSTGAGRFSPDPDELDRVAEFAQAMTESDDIDPVYPVLKAIHRITYADEDARWWLTALYLGTYNLPSAVTAWLGPRYPTISAGIERLPIGIERRGLRGGTIREYLADYVRQTDGDQRGFMVDGWGPDPYDNYISAWGRAQEIKYNGRWAAFKWLEILKKVHGENIAAPDMRMEYCSGPREGLERLYGLHDPGIDSLNDAGAQFRSAMERRGVHLDWEGYETILCNYYSLMQGRYYVGHDIDEMQEQMQHPSVSSEALTLLISARGAALPERYLGEMRGRHGIAKDRMRMYRESRAVVVRR